MNTKRLPLIVCVMTEWPSGFVQIASREGTTADLGVDESANGETSHTIPHREFFGAVSARHHGDIDAETADARATREAFRAAARKYGYR
jgi:hypothetical protein